MWFQGDADGPGGYPVTTNFTIEQDQSCTVIFTMAHDNPCPDQGICFFSDGTTPQWDWGPNSTRIALQMDCPLPVLFGNNPEGDEEAEAILIPPGDEDSLLLAGHFYTWVVVYNPLTGVTATVYDGVTVDGQPQGEPLNSGSGTDVLPVGPYRVGFSADNDDEDTKAYFTYFSVGDFVSASGQQPLPRPVYTFRVVLPNKALDTPLADTLANIEYAKANTTVWVDHVDHPLKNGDEFTLFGQEAMDVKRGYTGKDDSFIFIVG
jgi:hypothetical protein